MHPAQQSLEFVARRAPALVALDVLALECWTTREIVAALWKRTIVR